jgi:hypothetical protein
MDSITIPVGAPCSFEALRELNPAATVQEISAAFEQLPQELRAQAWAQTRLRVALEAWNYAAGEPTE